MTETVAQNHAGRVFAVVPAAGHSRRMGRPKLLLSVDGRSVIRRLVEALSAAGVTATYVLVRAEDQALQAEVADTGAIVVTSAETPDMRGSVETLLREVAHRESPGRADTWLLAPADHPLLSPDVIAQLLAAPRDADEILVPTFAGRRGHPTLFSWSFAERRGEIPAGQGVNWLLRQYAPAVREVAVSTPDVLRDLDTPEDYQEWQRSMAQARRAVCDDQIG